MSGEEANVKVWANCKYCYSKSVGKSTGEVFVSNDFGGGYDEMGQRAIGEYVPCPQCAAHFKALRAAVEDFKVRLISHCHEWDLIEDYAEAIRALPIEGDQ